MTGISCFLNQLNYLVSSLIANLIFVPCNRAMQKDQPQSIHSFKNLLHVLPLFPCQSFQAFYHVQHRILFFSFFSLLILNCMTKLCSVYKRNVKLFLNVDLEQADLDQQRKLLRPFRLILLKHMAYIFVSYVKSFQL